MQSGKNTIDLPPGHEVIYQDEDMVISLDTSVELDPDDELGSDYEAGNVYFWYFEVDADDEDFPLRWDAFEDKKIVLEESNPPGEPVAVLSVLSALREEQKVLIGAKAASSLARRFKKPLQAIKGPRLEESQELLYNSDGCVAILTKGLEGFRGFRAVSVFWDKWKDEKPSIWQHELGDSISTHQFPEGQFAIIPVVSSDMATVGKVVPMELAEILAKRFGKRIEPQTRSSKSSAQSGASGSGNPKSGGCASILCLLMGITTVALLAMH